MSGAGAEAARLAAVHTRLAEWQMHVRAAMATRRLDLPFATYVMTDDLPDIYDLNLAVVTAPVSPQVLLRSVDKVAEAAGWTHRRIEIDDVAVADRLRTPLLAAGLTEQRFVTMMLDAVPPTPAAKQSAVVDIGAQLDLARAVTAEQPWADGDRILDQFAERERRLAGVAGGRAVIAPPDAPVSRCLLLTDGRLFEIDALVTLEAHRAQGWSRAVVQGAIDHCRALDAEHIVLVADDDDWPKAWYRRLGFREIGHSFAFQRTPATA